MPKLLFFILLGSLLFAAVFLFGCVLCCNQIHLKRRLLQIQNLIPTSQSQDVLTKSFKERFFLPLWKGMSRTLLKWAPKELKNHLVIKLAQAGYPFGIGVETFLVLQGVALILLPLFTGGLGLLYGLPIKNILILAGYGLALGLLFPLLILSGGVTKHHRAIERQLPDTLDLLTISVEAGLVFDAALVKVVEKSKGVLSDEFQRTLQEIGMGKLKAEALKDLGSRTGVDDLASFVAAVVQADQLGVPLANILRVQSDEMRRRRRQRAEEAAMKAPVKMLFPLVFCIFPALFIVLLGPAVIRVYETFIMR